jgi:hypothetical protein
VTGQDAVVNIIMRALRAEAGVRRQQAAGKSTEFYAGRRSGFVASAATVLATMYDENFEQAEHLISQHVQDAGEKLTTDELVDPAKTGNVATEIFSGVLLK